MIPFCQLGDCLICKLLVKDFRLFAFDKEEFFFSLMKFPFPNITGFITDLKLTYKYRKTCFGCSNWNINLRCQFLACFIKPYRASWKYSFPLSKWSEEFMYFFFYSYLPHACKNWLHTHILFIRNYLQEIHLPDCQNLKKFYWKNMIKNTRIVMEHFKNL